LVSYTEEQILETIKENYKGEKIMLMAPVVRSRKGHYHELFVQMAKKGYGQARIDGELQDIEYDLKLDRYKTHDIDIVIDRWIIGESLPKQNGKIVADSDGNGRRTDRNSETGKYGN
jgi:excinuclease ABC subunit A